MQIAYVQEILNMSIYTFMAGISGALVTFLRKSNEGTVQAKLIGFVTAFFSVMFIVPLLLSAVSWKLSAPLPVPIERGGAFAFGLMAQYLTETFTNDPTNALITWNRNVRKIIKNIWNPETPSVVPPITNQEGQDDGK